MKTEKTTTKIFPHLKFSIKNLIENKIIIFPFLIGLFIQLYLLELLCFIPRWPMKIFFGPIIAKTASENFLHYPVYLILLPRIFQTVQIIFYIFFSGYFIAVTSDIINTINSGKTVQPRVAFRRALSSYVHIFVAALLSFLVVMGLFKLYSLLFNRAILIRSQEGIYLTIKNIVIYGMPYFNLLISIFVTTLFAYVIPIIMIEKKKVFAAFIMNFKMLWGSFWFTFLIVLIPSIFYAPLILFRSKIPMDAGVPELRIWILIGSIVITAIIDTIVYSSLTTYYLLKKGQ